MDPSAAQYVLMYFILPLWLAAGFADYLCHRASHIEATSGPKESALHLLQFAEMAVPSLAIFLEINALVILVGMVCLVLHQATSFGCRTEPGSDAVGRTHGSCAHKAWNTAERPELFR